MAHQLFYSTSKLERFVLSSVYKNANIFQLRRYLSLIRNGNETSTMEHIRNQWRLLCNEPPKGFEKFYKQKKFLVKQLKKLLKKSKKHHPKKLQNHNHLECILKNPLCILRFLINVDFFGILNGMEGISHLEKKERETIFYWNNINGITLFILATISKSSN